MYDERSGQVSFHQRVVVSDQGHGSVAIAAAGYPPHANRAANAGSRYAQTVRSTSTGFSGHESRWPCGIGKSRDSGISI